MFRQSICVFHSHALQPCRVLIDTDKCFCFARKGSLLSLRSQGRMIPFQLAVAEAHKFQFGFTGHDLLRVRSFQLAVAEAHKFQFGFTGNDLLRVRSFQLAVAEGHNFQFGFHWQTIHQTPGCGEHQPLN